MKTSVVLCFFLSGALGASAQSLYRADHGFEKENPQLKYDWFLGRTVFQAYPAEAELSFYVMPSFKAQYGVCLRTTRSGYEVVSTRARRDLWSVTENWSQLAAEQIVALAKRVNDAGLIETFRRDVDRATGERVVREWQRLLSESRVGDRPMGLDGATAVFCSFFGEGRRVSRDAWSPKVGTPARKLWEIGDALCAFARGENQELIEKALLLPSKEQPEKTGTLDD